MPCLDTNFSITFVSEDGKQAVFHPIDTSEFIDYLVELNPDVAQDIMSEDFTPTREVSDFLQEAVSSYIEAIFEDGEDLPSECHEYYSTIYNFLQDAQGSELYVTLQEGEEADIEVDNELYNFFEVTGWNINIPNSANTASLIQEITFKKMVRGGRLIKRAECAPGYRWDGKRCIRMGSTEVRKRMKAAFRASKTRAKHSRNALFMKMILKKRMKSDRVRRQKGLK